MNVLRNVLLTAFAASVLAGCQSTTPRRDCDFIKKPLDQKYWGGECCNASQPGSPCYKGGGGDKPNDPDPRPQ